MAADTKTIIKLMTVSPTTVGDYASSDVDDILAKVGPDGHVWIHVGSLRDSVTSAKLLEHFGLPASLAEHIGSSVPAESETGSESYLFKKFRFIVQTATTSAAAPEQNTSRLLMKGGKVGRLEEAGGALILGKKFLLSFGDQHTSRLMDNARIEILRRKKEAQQGVDYVLYRLMHVLVIENYLTVFRQFMDRLQEAEETLLEGTTDAGVYRDVVELRRELRPFGRSLLYADDFTGALIHEKPLILSESSIAFFAENLGSDVSKLEKEFSLVRERTSELIQTYRDNANTQLNNTMRTLTVLSSLFLPLNFIAAFYGMNFPNMPAVKWNGSFPIVTATMILIVVGGVMYARKHKWL